MGFDASNAVEALDFDFNPHLDLAGTVPEPSEKVLRDFQKRMLAQADKLGVKAEDMADPRDIVKALGKVPEKKLEQLSDHILDALAVLCQGNPSREQLAEVPPRIRNAFMGWLTGLVFPDPTQQRAVTSASRAMVNGGAPTG